MQKRQRKRIGQILKEMDVITEADVQEILQQQSTNGGLFGELCIRAKLCDEDTLSFALGAQFGLEHVNLDEMEVPIDVLDLIDIRIVESYNIIPVDYDPDENRVTVAVTDPSQSIYVQDELRMLLSVEVEIALTSPSCFRRAVDKYYAGKKSETIDDIMSKEQSDLFSDASRESVTDTSIDDPNAAPVVKLLNMVLLQAIKDKASDVHLEPFDGEFRVRYRIDGVLYEMEPPPAHLASALTSRVKVMSKLDIAETRLPQDGRIEITIRGRPIDLRVSTLPTMFGESVVLRVLDRANVNLELAEIGLRPRDLELVQTIIKKPNGIILVTGPTGSGKTTTLYSALNYLNEDDVKIITTEDPVEYDLPGICQCPIMDEIGVTYAACLRSILRQDPDIILVGEVRDLETAQIAVQASLTGHIVLTTLHTNDAPSAVTRLLDLGVDNFLIAATLEAIVAQRLVRKICLNCRTPYQPGEEELYELGLSPADVEGKEFYFGEGCRDCNGTGYSGRTALFEIMICEEQVRQMIMEDHSTAQLRELAIGAAGMRTLRDTGLLAIYDGTTTIEEVVKETILTT
ncbi:MAG: pilus assembly protein PilB [Planctomycetota bacterium]|nr:MAG: pilus assembly protein PilB [Planctomycetota bacterium]